MILTASGRPTIRKSGLPDEDWWLEFYRPLIEKYRAELIEEFPFVCPECGLTACQTKSADDLDWNFHLCRRTMCPFWRPGHPDSSPGLERQRKYEEWLRGKRSEDEQRMAEPVPE